jgi:hypothetical protein
MDANLLAGSRVVGKKMVDVRERRCFPKEVE